MRLLRSQWDRFVGGVLLLAGLILSLGVIVRVGGMRFGQDRLSLIMSGGGVGLAAGCVGATLLASARFHDNWRRLHELELVLRDPVIDGEGPDAGPTLRRHGLLPGLKAQRDRIGGFMMFVVATALLAVGIRNVASSLYETEQIAFITSAGIGALFLFVLGSAAMLSADLEDEERKLDRIDVLAAGGVLLSPRRALMLAGEGRVVLPDKSSPQPKGPMVLFGIGLIAELVLVALGWAKAAGALQLRSALAGLAIATVGLFMGVAQVAALLYRRRLRTDSRAADARRRIEKPSAILRLERPGGEGAWTADGLRLFHRSGCAVLDNPRLRLRAVNPGDEDQLAPCLLCCAAGHAPVSPARAERTDRTQVTNHA